MSSDGTSTQCQESLSLARTSDRRQSDVERSEPSVALQAASPVSPLRISKVRPPPGVLAPISVRTILSLMPLTGVLLHTHQPTPCPPHSSYLEVFSLGRANDRVVCKLSCWYPKCYPNQGFLQTVTMNPKALLRKRMNYMARCLRNFRVVQVSDLLLGQP